MATELICERCGGRGALVKSKRGYELVSWSLYYAFVASLMLATITNAKGADAGPVMSLLFGAWLLHVLFRFVTTRKVCPSCGAAKTMLPVESPQGQKLLREFSSTATDEGQVTVPTPRRWLRLIAAAVPLAAFAASVVWGVSFDPTPTQACYRFARNVIKEQTGGAHPDTVQEVTRLTPGAEAAEEKIAGACISGATAIRESKGRAVYVKFLDCIRDAESERSLQSCLAQVADHSKTAQE